MGQRVSRSKFDWVYTDEPHASRRKRILEDHPEIKDLMGPDPRLKYIVTCMVIFQLASAFCVAHFDLSWPTILVLAYAVGGVVNHSMTLAIHEISHNLAFGHGRPGANRLLGIFGNLPIAVPYSVSFKKYHLEHHRYQGVEGRDMDLPSALEAKLFYNAGTKLLWLLLQPLFYSLRPVVMYPMPMTWLEAFNVVVQLAFDVALAVFVGPKALIYLLAGTLLALGLHPVAGHFISEHYVFKKGYETYSYYGLLNCITFNVGYHNEHHDFPFIAGRNLPKVRAIAPEWYDNLPCHNSWVRVLWDFVMDPDVGPYARVKRAAPKADSEEAKKLAEANKANSGEPQFWSPMLTPDYSLAKKKRANGAAPAAGKAE